MNRGVAKQSAPGHGPAASITDYDHAVELWETLERDQGPADRPRHGANIWHTHGTRAPQRRRMTKLPDRE